MGNSKKQVRTIFELIILYLCILVLLVKLEAYAWLICLVCFIAIIRIYFPCYNLRNHANIEPKLVVFRGINRLMMSGSDERLYKRFLSQDEYTQDGHRICKWKAPKGFVHTIHYENGINYEILTPERDNGRVVFMLHGGAYVGKLTDQFMNLGTFWSEANGYSKVFMLDYHTTLDDAPYPAPINETVTCYRWLLKEYSPENILICGDSAGGNLALELGLYLKKHPLPMPKGIITLSAWTDLSEKSISYQINQEYDSSFGRNHILEMATEEYLKNTNKTLQDPAISPYYGDFTGFCPLLMQASSWEMLRDSSVDVVKKAEEAGVDATVQLWDGGMHDFQMLKGQLKIADEAWKEIKVWIQKLYKEENDTKKQEEDKTY